MHVRLKMMESTMRKIAKQVFAHPVQRCTMAQSTCFAKFSDKTAAIEVKLVNPSNLCRKQKFELESEKFIFIIIFKLSRQIENKKQFNFRSIRFQFYISVKSILHGALLSCFVKNVNVHYVWGGDSYLMLLAILLTNLSICFETLANANFSKAF